MSYVIYRTDPVSVQILCRNVDKRLEWKIIVGHGPTERFTLGPYDTEITLVEAMALVATEMRLTDPTGLVVSTQPNLTAMAVASRMGV